MKKVLFSAVPDLTSGIYDFLQAEIPSVSLGSLSDIHIDTKSAQPLPVF